MMLMETPEDRVAVLLKTLGIQPDDPILDSLPEARVNRVRIRMAEFESDAVDEDEVDAILNEFLRMLRFAKRNEPKLKIAQIDDTDETKEEDDHHAPTVAETSEFVPSEDPFADLQRLRPTQIAGALRDEQPTTACLVLSCLPSQIVGLALQYFPEDRQNEIFMMLRNPPSAPAPLMERIVRAAVDKGSQLGDEALSDPEEESYRRLAEVLRAMEQSERAKILEGLATSDPEANEKIRKLLFVFDDVIRVTDRCIQKILTEVDSETLTKALKNAPPEYLSKFANNLSKRARATLLEEIEFMGSVKKPEEEEARDAICAVMSELDQRGDLEFE